MCASGDLRRADDLKLYPNCFAKVKLFRVKEHVLHDSHMTFQIKNVILSLHQCDTKIFMANMKSKEKQQTKKNDGIKFSVLSE